jgi:NAD(P)-dependent dehydrogenase (short-subunit alcohol dehydrogenase family)
MRGLKGKRVLITGGAGGIGSATAARFLEEGARVVVIDKDEVSCRRLEKDLPGIEEILVADVSLPEAVERFFKQVDLRMGGLDVLINNAGVSTRHKFIDITPDEWKRVIETNLNGVSCGFSRFAMLACKAISTWGHERPARLILLLITTHQRRRWWA